MTYVILELKEQKYVGIKTVIRFEEHDDIDFLGLHKEVKNADIKNIDEEGHFMAMDTDFSKESFSYTPLMPVKSYDRNDIYTTFTREHGTFYAFEVTAQECGPEWFGKLFKYIEAKKLNVAETGYDLEYYDKAYLNIIDDDREDDRNKAFRILLKRKD